MLEYLNIIASRQNPLMCDFNRFYDYSYAPESKKAPAF